MFIFGRCLHSSAVETAVKYVPDIIHVTRVFIIMKKWEHNETEITVYAECIN